MYYKSKRICNINNANILGFALIVCYQPKHSVIMLIVSSIAYNMINCNVHDFTIVKQYSNVSIKFACFAVIKSDGPCHN